MGRHAEALEHFQEAARLKPNWPEPLARLGWLLATSENPDCRQPQQAIVLAQRACWLTNYTNPEYLRVLAAAYVANNRFDQAIQTIIKRQSN